VGLRRQRKRHDSRELPTNHIRLRVHMHEMDIARLRTYGHSPQSALDELCRLMLADARKESRKG